MSEDLQTAWDSNHIINYKIVQRLPTGDGQEWVMSGNLNPPSGLGRDRETRLDPAVDPSADTARLNAASWRKAEDGRTLALHKLFDG